MVFQLKGRVVFFVTNNIHKFNEARRVLAEHEIAVGMLKVKASEIQSENLEEIASESVSETLGRCSLPLMVEDAGLFIDALNGFPGPYTAYVHKTIGNKGLIKLMKEDQNRKAIFHSVVAYHSTELKSPVCFKGEVLGEITRTERRGGSERTFGFDPIFKPVNSGKTFAEMTIQEKNKHSHRAQAMRKFAEWYKKTRTESRGAGLSQ